MWTSNNSFSVDDSYFTWSFKEQENFNQTFNIIDPSSFEQE